MNKYQEIFTDFDYDYIALGQQLGDKWQDTTWKNNSCPSFGMCIKEDTYTEFWYTLWFDYKNIMKSEFTHYRNKKQIKQFGLSSEMGEYIFQTDDWESMKKFIEEKGVENHYNNVQEVRATSYD